MIISLEKKIYLDNHNGFELLNGKTVDYGSWKIPENCTTTDCTEKMANIFFCFCLEKWNFNYMKCKANWSKCPSTNPHPKLPQLNRINKVSGFGGWNFVSFFYRRHFFGSRKKFDVSRSFNEFLFFSDIFFPVRAFLYSFS